MKQFDDFDIEKHLPELFQKMEEFSIQEENGKVDAPALKMALFEALEVEDNPVASKLFDLALFNVRNAHGWVFEIIYEFYSYTPLLIVYEEEIKKLKNS